MAGANCVVDVRMIRCHPHFLIVYIFYGGALISASRNFRSTKKFVTRKSE